VAPCQPQVGNCDSAQRAGSIWSKLAFGVARGAIECIIDADPVAACVREIMAERSSNNGFGSAQAAAAPPATTTLNPI
jgi:hypothetical protein